MITTLVSSILMLSSMAHHGPPVNLPTDSVVRARMNSQVRQIKKGIHQGSLTRSESRFLFRKQRQLKNRYKRYMRNRRLSLREKRSMNRALKIQSKRIYRLRHNTRVRHFRRAFLTPRLRVRPVTVPPRPVSHVRVVFL